MSCLRRDARHGLIAALASLSACFIDLGTSAGGPGATTDIDSTGGDLTTTSTTTTAGTSTSGASTADTTLASTSETTATGTTCAGDLWFPDDDGDGHGGAPGVLMCGPPPQGYVDNDTDCDDTDEQVHPGADELCDARDNDCDGGVDEWPLTQDGVACNDCTGAQYREHIYYFCTPERPWADARTACQTLLGDLAVISDKDEQKFVGEQISPDLVRAWIGLSDQLVEGIFVAIDGSLPTETFWANGEPNDGETNEFGSADCVAMSGELLGAGLWRDQVCTSVKSSVCEAATF